MQNAVEITHLRKSYGKHIAVDDLSFSIPRGEFFGFLGPNGAGKTTTIHCMTGIATYEEGSIKIFGIDAKHDYRKARMRIGFSPQEFNAGMFTKLWQVLDYMGGYYGIPKQKRRRRVEQLLDQFGLEEHKDKEFRELSGGYKRRAILARAMVHDPDLLILDEPTAGVDVELRHELWAHLRELNKKGKTIFLTSHYLEEVEMLCNRIAIINKGKIAVVGAKNDFMKDGKRLEEAYLKVTKGETY